MSIPNGQNYPIFAQNAFITARDSTGKIVCANCHLLISVLYIEVPQSIFSSAIVAVRLIIPVVLSLKQLTGLIFWLTTVNLGCVLLVPDGFTLASGIRLRSSEKLLTEGIYLQPFSGTCNNIIVVGPIDCLILKRTCLLDFPILSHLKRCCSISYCSGTYYSVFGGVNLGRGQFYPTGDNSNTFRVVKSILSNLHSINFRANFWKLFF